MVLGLDDTARREEGDCAEGAGEEGEGGRRFAVGAGVVINGMKMNYSDAGLYVMC